MEGTRFLRYRNASRFCGESINSRNTFVIQTNGGVILRQSGTKTNERSEYGRTALLFERASRKVSCSVAGTQTASLIEVMFWLVDGT